jgi:hypothetical protein
VDDRPVTRYAQAPDRVSLAYQVTGDGPVDLVFLTTLAFPVDLLWDEPSFVRFAKRLGGFTAPCGTSHEAWGPQVATPCWLMSPKT